MHQNVYPVEYNNFLDMWHKKNVTDVPYNPTGQTVTERSNRTSKEMLAEQKGAMECPRDRLTSALYHSCWSALDLGRTAELDQHKYVITSERKAGNVLHWGREQHALIAVGKEKLRIPSQ